MLKKATCQKRNGQFSQEIQHFRSFKDFSNCSKNLPKGSDGASRFDLKCEQVAKRASCVVFQKNQRKKLCCKDKVVLICGKNDPSKWSDRLQKFVKLKARQNRKKTENQCLNLPPA